MFLKFNLIFHIVPWPPWLPFGLSWGFHPQPPKSSVGESAKSDCSWCFMCKGTKNNWKTINSNRKSQRLGWELSKQASTASTTKEGVSFKLNWRKVSSKVFSFASYLLAMDWKTLLVVPLPEGYSSNSRYPHHQKNISTANCSCPFRQWCGQRL